MPTKRHNWNRARGWHTHSLACWDAEWLEIQKAAEAAGKPVNRWIRDGLKEMVRYERVAAQDDRADA